jgi:hypothetical protein
MMLLGLAQLPTTLPCCPPLSSTCGALVGRLCGCFLLRYETPAATYALWLQFKASKWCFSAWPSRLGTRARYRSFLDEETLAAAALHHLGQRWLVQIRHDNIQ